MNTNIVHLLGKQKVLEEKIAHNTIKVMKARKSAENLFKFLTKIEAGKKSSVRNRALIHNNRFSIVLTKLISLL
jgi:hypothetical protein